MAYSPSFSYNPATTGPLAPIYQLRLRLSDTNFSNVTGDLGRRSVLFSDQEYALFLANNMGNLDWATYEALSVAANNAAMASITMELGGGGSINWAARAEALNKQAQVWFEKANQYPVESYSPQNTGPTAAGNIIWNEFQRETAG